MFENVRDKSDSKVDGSTGGNRTGFARGRGCLLLTAAAAFALVISAPVTLDLNGGTDSVLQSNTADAQGKGGGGGKGSGKGGGKGGGKGHKGGKGGTSSNSESGESILIMNVNPGVNIAAFTTEIRRRYPADNIGVLTDPNQAVSFFTEINGMKGEVIVHRWVYGGAVQFEAVFNVMSPSWRVWSTQLLPSQMPGEWMVEVVNAEGEILESRSLKFQPMTAGSGSNNG